MKLCETRLAVEDAKAIHWFVREFHRFEMFFNETGLKFVDRIKSHVAKIASQNERTDTTIITVAKEGIRLQYPMLYQVLEIISDLSLDKLCKEISKRTVSERSFATKMNVCGARCLRQTRMLGNSQKTIWSKADQITLCVQT